MKLWNRNKRKTCTICRVNPAMSDTAKTCSYSCAAKLAWQSIDGTKH